MSTYYISLFSLLMFLLKTQFIYPQWIKTNGPNGGFINSLAINGTNVLAGSEFSGDIFYSTDTGGNWKKLLHVSPMYHLRPVAFNGTDIIIGNFEIDFYARILISTDNGISWNSSNVVTNGGGKYDNTFITSITANKENIFVGTQAALYRSTDYGGAWKKVLSSNVNTIAINDMNIYVGTNGSGVYLSTDNGTNWSQANNGLTNTTIESFTFHGNNIFTGTRDGIFLSTDNGINWTLSGLANKVILNLATSGSNLFAGTMSGFYFSTNNGANWIGASYGLPDTIISHLIVDGNNIFTGFWSGIYFSNNNGTNWKQIGLPVLNVNSMIMDGNSIYAGTTEGVQISLNNGTNWELLGLKDFAINAVIANSNFILAATSSNGVFLSTNSGTNWIQSGFSGYISSFAVDGANIFAGYEGVYLSTDNGMNWTPAGLTGTYVNSFAVIGSNVFAGTSKGVFLTTNHGIDWTHILNGLPDTSAYSLAVSGNNIFAICEGSGVYLSTNNGMNWTQKGIIGAEVNFLSVTGNYILAATNNGIYFSSNNGTNWIEISDGLPVDSGNQIFVAGNDNYVFASRVMNAEGLWRRPLSEILPVELTSFTANVSRNNINLNWKTATELNNMGFDIERSINKYMWTKMAFVKGNGNSYSPKDYSYIDKSVNKVGRYYYRLKQIDKNGTYKYSYIVEADLFAPPIFALDQNFPNPWNPSTKINYTLPFDSKVILEVYNISGERISQLVNKDQSAGYYSVDFNASKLSSGIYFYRITAIDKATGKDFAAIKKMVLLK